VEYVEKDGSLNTNALRPCSRQVRALVRGRDQAALEAIPQSVAVVKGDIGDYDDCLKAMQVPAARHRPKTISFPVPLRVCSACRQAQWWHTPNPKQLNVQSFNAGVAGV
jgi:hypothetical protein